MAYEQLIDNLHCLSSEKGINITSALIESGAGKNFIYNIRRGSAPSADKLALLADYFHVTTDYLLGRTDEKQPAAGGAGDGLTEAERALIELYRLLTPEQQDMVDQVARTAAAAQKSSAKPRP